MFVASDYGGVKKNRKPAGCVAGIPIGERKDGVPTTDYYPFGVDTSFDCSEFTMGPSATGAQPPRRPGATDPVSDAAPPKESGAEPPSRGGRLAALNRTGEETVRTGHEQLRHGKDDTGDPGWGWRASRQPPLSRRANFSRRSRTFDRPRSARKRLGLSIALLATAAAVHAAFIYIECYTRLSAAGAHGVGTATRLRVYGVGSSSRRLAWGGQKEEDDACSGLSPKERSEDAAEGRQENQVISEAGGGWGGEDDDDDGLQDAVEAELERLRSLLLEEEQERGEGSAEAQSYQYPPADEVPMRFLVRVLGLALDLEVQLSQLVEEGHALADRAAVLRREGLTPTSSSPARQEEMKALRKRAREVVIISDWIAEKVCVLERAARYHSRKLNMLELLPAAVAAASWPLPTPNEPLDLRALAIVRVTLGGVESLLDWVEAMKHHARTVSHEEDENSGADTSPQEMATLLNLAPRLRPAVSSLRERLSAWRTSARIQRFRLLDLAPGDTQRIAAFRYMDGLRRRLALEGLPSTVEDIVVEGGLDRDSLDVCDELLRRRILRIEGRALSGSPRAQARAIARDQGRVARARLALAIIEHQLTDAPPRDETRRPMRDFGYADWWWGLTSGSQQ